MCTYIHVYAHVIYICMYIHTYIDTYIYKIYIYTSNIAYKELPSAMQNFEKDLLDSIKLIKFQIVKDNFQRTSKEDISNISSADVCAFTDKTTNVYKLLPQDYKKLLHKNIMKSYKKSSTRLEKSINPEAKEIAAGIKIDDRIEYMARAPAYITLKDRKDNFRSAHPCRLKRLQK